MRQNAILTLILILMSGFQAHSFAYLTNHQVNLLTNMNDESGPFAMTIWRDNDRHKRVLLGVDCKSLNDHELNLLDKLMTSFEEVYVVEESAFTPSCEDIFGKRKRSAGFRLQNTETAHPLGIIWGIGLGASAIFTIEGAYSLFTDPSLSKLQNTLFNVGLVGFTLYKWINCNPQQHRKKIGRLPQEVAKDLSGQILVVTDKNSASLMQKGFEAVFYQLQPPKKKEKSKRNNSRIEVNKTATVSAEEKAKVGNADQELIEKADVKQSTPPSNGAANNPVERYSGQNEAAQEDEISDEETGLDRVQRRAHQEWQKNYKRHEREEQRRKKRAVGTKKQN